MSTSTFGIVFAVALLVFAAGRFWPGKRRLQRRIATQQLDEFSFRPDEVMVENLVSLAVASSMAADASSGRWRRRVVAAVGAVGVVGWASSCCVGGGVVLASTGNLPDPMQRAVADVLDVVNIGIPRPNPSTVISPDTGDVGATTNDTAVFDEQEVVELDVSVMENEVSVTEIDVSGTESEVAPGQSGDAPGQSGDAPGQSGDAPGQSGDAPGQSGDAPGQSGDAPGQSGDAPGQSGSRRDK